MPSRIPSTRDRYNRVAMTWEALFFDLDGTLYPLSCGLWQAVGARIEAFLQAYLGLSPEAARALRQRFGCTYGTTLRGLQVEYGMPPDPYLDYVNQVPVEAYLRPDPELRRVLESLPYPKWVFTNADRPYTERVLRALGLEGVFTGLITIEALDWVPKPAPQAFERAWALAGVQEPARTWLLDDMPRNVRGALAMGMQAALVAPEPQDGLPWLPDLRQLPTWLKQAEAKSRPMRS